MNAQSLTGREIRSEEAQKESRLALLGQMAKDAMEYGATEYEVMHAVSQMHYCRCSHGPHGDTP
jgi:hypothetical protein